MKKKYLLVIICIFLCFLVLPAVISIAKGDNEYSETENRSLAVRPDFSFSDLMDGFFQSDYEEYIVDQFMFRDAFVTAKTNFLKAIGCKDINNTYLGKDNYLIKKYNPSGFDTELIEENIDYLTTFLNDSAEEYDSVNCVLVPSKGSVMTDKLPDNAVAYNTDFYANSIKNNLSRSVNFLNLKSTLTKHNDEYIYYKTDHHWTTLGAFYAYNSFEKNLLNKSVTNIAEYKTEKVSDSFFGSDYDSLQLSSAVADQITAFRDGVKVKVDYNGDDKNSKSLYINKYLKEKDKYSFFLGGNYRKINITTDCNNEKKALIIKDSFTNSLIPFLVSDFSEIVMVDLRYCEESIYDILDEEDDITDVFVIYNIEKFMTDENQWVLE